MTQERPGTAHASDAALMHADLVQMRSLFKQLEIMEQRYQDSLTLDTLAQELAISPYHLHRVFKRLTGTTPAGYILDRRLRVAQEALCSEPSRTVTDIAMEAGFRSTSHFSTVFQKETGFSPSNYRKLYWFTMR